MTTTTTMTTLRIFLPTHFFHHSYQLPPIWVLALILHHEGKM
jgi:hypothetical protein